ncbi:MAG: tRNA (adenosine(37)-N6)-dimethylallyltransferase MiaA [Anaerolineae bacterium]|nr:tRNA (adenosine(37)-N6)-dimethylallyltransferase MiaA [Anaerolineae bacterium]MDW8170957.1 tRNA (adenosine(37)-N6)-dimethylallyltransferase MiaA [Anaerolineae bacterium]
MNGKVVVILGATATGKTNLALDLAEALDGEIVGADSRQMYRLMDIGTAKPTSAQRARVRHHLVDIVDPDQTLSLAEVLDMTRAAVEDVLARGKLPFLVGGTGQYITAFTEGWTIPRVPPQPALRAELEAYAAQHGTARLYARLQALDPDQATRIHPNNLRRIVRALEVCLVSGSAMSQQQRKAAPPYDFLLLGLTMPRESLYARADARSEAMFSLGFLDEVRHLLALGYERHLPSFSAVGYPECCAHLLDGLALEEAKTQMKFNTHAFIRRQEIWFRGHDRGILWHNGLELRTEALIVQLSNWMKYGIV